MRIEKIEIKGFGKLSEASFRLSEGLNLVYGENETGKSTLQAFIKAMLYGLKGGRSGRDGMPAPVKRYRPWSGGSFGGAMEYRLANGMLFRVERDFERNSAVIYDGHFNNLSGSFASGKDKTLAFAEKHVGMNEACFERTVFVKQMEARLDEDGASVLSGRLANAGETGFEDISFKNAERALKEALINHVGTGRSSVRPVDRLNERLGELAARKKELEASGMRLSHAREDLKETVAERDGLLTVKAFTVKARKLVELRKKLAERMAAESALKDAVKHIQELESKLEWLMNEHEQGSRSQRGQKDRSNVPTGNAERIGNPSPRFGAGIGLIAAAAFVIFSILTLLLGRDYSPYSYGAALILLLAAAGLLLSSILRSKKKADGKTAHGLAETEADAAAAGYEEKLRAVMQLKDRQKELYNKAALASGSPAGSLDELKRLAAEASEAVAAYEKELSEGVRDICFGYGKGNESSLGGANLEEVFYDASPEWLDNETSREEGKTARLLEEKALKIRELETLLQNDLDDEEILQKIEEEEASVSEKKAELERKGASLKLALEVLEEAGSEVRSGLTPVLEKRMGFIAGKMTGGRYADLRLDEGLALNTISPETGNVSHAGILSGGTADQLYLALRLATADVLAPGGEYLPVFLDEIFSQYDDIRTRQTLKFLLEEYGERQVVIFTCKERETALAQDVCGDKLNLLKLHFS